METYLVHEGGKPCVFCLLSDGHIVEVEFLHFFDELSKQDKFLASQVVLPYPDYNVAILLHHLSVHVHKTSQAFDDGNKSNK